MGKLTKEKIKKATTVGKYPDGAGLYLVVGKSGSRSWVFRYSLNKKCREMGLGGVDSTPLEEARDVAIECRKALRSGVDPINQRQRDKTQRIVAESRAIKFRDCANQYIESHCLAWSNKRQRAIWENSLTNHVYDHFGDYPVSEVTRDMVANVIRRMWKNKNKKTGADEPLYDSSRRVMNRIERILEYAKAMEYRSGDNPARWKGNLDLVFPDVGKIVKVEHQPSVPRSELPKLFRKVSENTNSSHSALAFLILTAARTSEVTGATWEEINFNERIWTVPDIRMKGRREHRVPLSDAAMAILEHRKAHSLNRFVFPGRIGGRHISNMAMLMLMRRYGRSEVPHGFRSTFKDWQRAFFPHLDDAGEMALSHAIAAKTKAAYAREDLLDQRIPLMSHWATFCLSG